jgi:simple sugar transport system substrate-binding protein/ribose transport system substrate-binding protein
MTTRFSVLKTIAISTALGASISAFAQGKGLDDPFRDIYYKTMSGKVVAFVPVALSFDLAQGWLEGLKKELEPLGVKIVARDPNWSTNAGAQAVTSLIGEKPDVIVVHNPDVQTYARLLRTAEANGIQVIQINMRSSYSSVAYVLHPGRS